MFLGPNYLRHIRSGFPVLKRHFSTHFDPRFRYDVFKYRSHRVYVEQLILRDKVHCPDIESDYKNRLNETRAYITRYIKKPISIFLPYSRPRLQEFPDEFFHQLFILHFAEDLKRMGFLPALDIMNYKESPEVFMRNSVDNSDCILLHGSRSMLHKQKYDPKAFVRIEIDYIHSRLRRNQKLEANQDFLLGVKLSDQPILAAFPNIFHKKCDVYEFTDDQGNSCKSYLDYMLFTMKKLLTFGLKDEIAIAALFNELDALWKQDLRIFNDNGYLSEEAFFSSIQLLKKSDQHKERSTLEYIAHRASLVDHALFDIEDTTKLSNNIIKTAFEKKIYWNLPPIAQDVHFLVRKKEMQWINESIAMQNGKLSRIGLYGLPGVGVVELINKWLLDNDFLFDAIFWFDASSADILQTQYNNFCREFGLIKDKNPVSEIDIVTRFKKHFENHNNYYRWLIVFDSVEDPQGLHAKMPRLGNGCIILTSTNREKLGHDMLCASNILEIQQMQLEEAVAFFKRLTGTQDAEKKDIEALVSALGCLPVAMRTAAHLCQLRGGISANHFLKELQSINGINFISYDKKLSILWEMMLKSFTKKPKDIKKMKHEIIVLATISVLKTLAYLSPNKIPERLLKDIVKHISGNSSFGEIYLPVITTLRSASVLYEVRDYHTSHIYYFINPLVQQFLKNKYELYSDNKKPNAKKYTDAAFVMRLLVTNVDYDSPTMQLSVASFDLLPHAEAFLKNIKLGACAVKKDAIIFELYCVTAQLAWFQSEYERALFFYEEARLHIPDHSEQIEYKTLHAIGQVYLAMRRNMEDYSLAEDHLTRGLELAGKWNNKISSDYAAILNDLARLYYDIGDYDRSIIACKEVIHLCGILSLPKTHLAYVLHDLAMAEFAKGDVSKAKDNFEESLRIKKKAYKNISIPTVAATKLGLAQVSYANDNVLEAISFGISSLNISEEYFQYQNYPRSHTGIAAAHNDLGCYHFKLGLLTKAFDHYISSLKIYSNLSDQEKNLNSLMVICNLAFMSFYIGEQSISQKLLQYVFVACNSSRDREDILNKIKGRLEILNYYKASFPPEDIDETLNELKLRVQISPSLDEEKLKTLQKSDLILSPRYGFFMAVKPQLVSNTEQDQGLNLVIN